MKIVNKFFEKKEFELRLIDHISLFYAFEVLIYTINDFKSDYPIWLILSGILFHTSVYLVASDQWRINPRISSIETREIIYKTLPFGLISTYLLSFIHDLHQLNVSAIDNVIRFMFTAIPMIIYFFFLGFSRAKKQQFGILSIRNRFLNISYNAVYIILFILGQYLK